jgi:hypothetical protein
MAPCSRNLQIFACDYPGCKKKSTRLSGIRQHYNFVHVVPTDLLPTTRQHHGAHGPMSIGTPEPPEDFSSDFQPHTTPPPTSSPQSTPLRQVQIPPLGSPQRPYPGIRINSAGIHIEKHPHIDGKECHTSPSQCRFNKI